MASLDLEVQSLSDQSRSEAIIILGGDIAKGRDGVDIGPLTLERLRAGAALHKRTGLPILVTGGVLGRDQPSIGSLMMRSLQDDFGIPVRWVEAEAADTRQNAIFSARMLASASIRSAYLVTHGWHLPRAYAAFRRVAFVVEPAPVRRETPFSLQWSDLAPRPDHLLASWYAMREWMGRLVYELRDQNKVTPLASREPLRALARWTWGQTWVST